ncbi:hypothetical protein [Kingella potus]|nr:hypothetical protein [Kingella potus]
MSAPHPLPRLPNPAHAEPYAGCAAPRRRTLFPSCDRPSENL